MYVSVSMYLCSSIFLALSLSLSLFVVVFVYLKSSYLFVFIKLCATVSLISREEIRIYCFLCVKSEIELKKALNEIQYLKEKLAQEEEVTPDFLSSFWLGLPLCHCLSLPLYLFVFVSLLFVSVCFWFSMYVSVFVIIILYVCVCVLLLLVDKRNE